MIRSYYQIKLLQNLQQLLKTTKRIKSITTISMSLFLLVIELNRSKAREEATELFARLRSDGLSAIWGNLQQSIFGEPAYATIESKAAHLLYFVVKNHPFDLTQH